MANGGFGSGLWKNLQAVQIDKDGTFRAPVKADGKSGILFGVDAIAASEARSTGPEQAEGRPRRRWWQRRRSAG